MLKEAQESFARAVRDEALYLERRKALKEKMEVEAKVAMTNLSLIKSDIDVKSEKYQARMQSLREAGQRQF